MAKSRVVSQKSPPRKPKTKIIEEVVEDHQPGLDILAPHDPVLEMLENAPLDDEPFTEDDQARLDEINALQGDDEEGREVTTTYALNATGPEGEVLAQSWDGGKTWKQTAAGVAFNRQTARRVTTGFTRKVMAVIDEPNPLVARRIMTPFSVLDRMKVLTGWAPLQAILALDEQSLDGVICPSLLHVSELEQLSRVARSIILDVDAPLDWDVPMQDKLFAMLPYCSGLMVPTPLIAGKLRPYHSRVFVVPHLLRRGIWQNVGQPPIRTVQVAIPHELETAQESAIALLRERYGERVTWQSFDWRTLDPLDELTFYRQFDVVVLPSFADRVQASLAPLLAPMAAQCVVVGDRHWTAINHRENGLMITRPDAKTWAQEINTLLQDRRLRLRIGRAARGVAMRHTAENKLSQIFLPYRVLVPESEPVSIEEAA
jgi:hypothetical protein